MSEEVLVTQMHNCDVCNQEGVRRPAYADAKLNIGPWAYVCLDHFKIYGCKLGTGRGQRLVLKVDA